MTRLRVIVLLSTALAVCASVYPRPSAHQGKDLPNRLPEAPPYITAEAQVFPPPYEEHWRTQNHPGQCQNCHQKIFDQWNGSMMSNSWRDPVWRAAFLLLARAVSTNGECDTPAPPDGTRKASHNPFARPGECASEFDLGTTTVTLSRPGSLLDGFCSRCHMPTNYVDNVPLRNVAIDRQTGLESAPVDPNFNPTSDNGTGIAFAALDSQFRNTDSGKTGIFCAVCHSYTATRDTPFHNYQRSGIEYYPAVGAGPRDRTSHRLDIFAVANPAQRNLGYSIGAGAYRLSPHALAFPERVGPLAAGLAHSTDDENTSTVFGRTIAYQDLDPSKHPGYHHAMFVRSEMCAACHDVTNALPIKNQLGRWVGGFPIERTYTEWASSRYADRPGNTRFDPRFKRDCQSCHMQQDYGQPGTAQTLYRHGRPLPPPNEPVAAESRPRPFFTHHFVGGNALVPRLIGKDVDQTGNVAPYPELSTFSFSSADHASPYSRALWTHVDRKGAYAQQGRMAWDRLRHVLTLQIKGAATTSAGGVAPLSISVANTGSGHNFPTGFPEGRIAWLAVHATDLATGRELPLRDGFWNRTSIGVGGLTTAEMLDPAFPLCHWELPPGSPDPYSIQFKAVASLGDSCPTLDLPYAAPLNLVTNRQGLPIDERGRVIEARHNPRGLPRFEDLNRNGDLFDDSFLRDSRLRPLPDPAATRYVDRYAVVVPRGVQGPIAVTATVYYQSVEAMVAAKFLGNLTDTNNNLVLEPCVLGGLCDGRRPGSEPPAVEGAPPVPMVVGTWVMSVAGAPPDETPPRVTTYPRAGAVDVYQDPVIKASFSEPVDGVNAATFTLENARGEAVPASVGQIGDGVYGLFPNQILLEPGATYTARLARACDLTAHCTGPVVWTFTVTADPDGGSGDTTIASGFAVAPRTFSQARRHKPSKKGQP